LWRFFKVPQDQSKVSRKMAGRKMALKARTVFIFLPAIFLLLIRKS